MTRADRYIIEIKTSKNLGAEAFVRGLLHSWREEIERRLRPEFFGLGEPVRRNFETEGMEEAVHEWLSNEMPLMLRRRSKPSFVVDMKWRPKKGKDQRPYPWGCTVWLDRSAKDELALILFQFLIHHFEPAFGSVTTEEDSRAKHWITFQDRLGQAEQYVGLDVTDRLPGIYWLTYFGPGAKRIVGEQSLKDLEADNVERLGDGYLMRAYPDVSAVGTQAAHQEERRILAQLGVEHFFDKSRVDIESLKTDEGTAARVERKIDEVKAARK